MKTNFFIILILSLSLCAHKAFSCGATGGVWYPTGTTGSFSAASTPITGPGHTSHIWCINTGIEGPVQISFVADTQPVYGAFFIFNSDSTFSNFGSIGSPNSTSIYTQWGGYGRGTVTTTVPTGCCIVHYIPSGANSADYPGVMGEYSATEVVDYGLHVNNLFTASRLKITNDADFNTIKTTGNVGIGATPVASATDNLQLYNKSGITVTQFANTSTGTGDANGFITGIDASGNGYLFHRNSKAIRFGTSGTERMRITSDGKVGLGGVTDPQYALHINGTIHATNIIANNLGTPNDTTFCILNGKVGMGTTSPSYKLHVKGTTYITDNVGIGTAPSSSEKLKVNGTIRAKEVTVSTSGFPDFVLAPDYNLRTLQEVESHIAVHGHLPDIPSAAEAEENGINLSEMNTRLLQKIEELMLYAIEQNKRLDKQSEEIESLKKQVKRSQKEKKSKTTRKNPQL